MRCNTKKWGEVVRIVIVACGLVVLGIIAFNWTDALSKAVVGEQTLLGAHYGIWTGLSPEAAAVERERINSTYGIWFAITIAGTVALALFAPTSSKPKPNSAVQDSKDSKEVNAAEGNIAEEKNNERNATEEKQAVQNYTAVEEIAVLKAKIAELENKATAVEGNDLAEREEAYKACPYCMENIKAGAVICRFCRSELTEAN